LKTLLAANKRLNRAYVLKESFGQLWSYEREGWARRFFENWRASLKWQRIKPYEKFAEMIDRHWDGIATYWPTARRKANTVSSAAGRQCLWSARTGRAGHHTTGNGAQRNAADYWVTISTIFLEDGSTIST
jgi:hypothetical protein